MTDAPDRLPHVSVVIAARDSAATLPACLTSLRALDYPSFDVIVADDGSRDETAEVARRHGAIVVETGGVGPSAARNAGVARSSAPVVAFTDADCTVTPQWLRALVEALGRPGAGAAGGPQLNVFRHPESGVNAAIDGFLRLSSAVADYTRRGGEAREVTHNASCNSAYRRSAFEAVGGFRVGLWPAEDVDLDYRLRAEGHRCYYAPAALVTHHRPGGRRWFARMMRRYGRSQGQLVRTHGVVRPVQAIPFLLVLAGASPLLLWPAATRPIVLAIDLAVVSLTTTWYAWTVPPHLWLPVARVAVRALVEWHLGFAAGLALGLRAPSPAVRQRSR